MMKIISLRARKKLAGSRERKRERKKERKSEEQEKRAKITERKKGFSGCDRQN